MTDDQIAKIGSTTGLRELSEMLDDDDWNNIEPALLEFARACIAVDRTNFRQRCAAICRKRKPWGNDADDWAAKLLEEAAAEIERLT